MNKTKKEWKGKKNEWRKRERKKERKKDKDRQKEIENERKREKKKEERQIHREEYSVKTKLLVQCCCICISLQWS